MKYKHFCALSLPFTAIPARSAFAVNDRATLSGGLQWIWRQAEQRNGLHSGINHSNTGLLPGAASAAQPGAAFSNSDIQSLFVNNQQPLQLAPLSAQEMQMTRGGGLLQNIMLAQGLTGATTGTFNYLGHAVGASQPITATGLAVSAGAGFAGGVISGIAGNALGNAFNGALNNFIKFNFGYVTGGYMGAFSEGYITGILTP